MSIDIMMPRRSALIKVNEFISTIMYNNGITADKGTKIKCHVLGVYQTIDGDGAGPVCVCELNNGKLLQLDPSYVEFTDTDDEGEII